MPIIMFKTILLKVKTNASENTEKLDAHTLLVAV